MVLTLIFIVITPSIIHAQRISEQENCDARDVFDHALRIELPAIPSSENVTKKDVLQAEMRGFLWNSWFRHLKACALEFTSNKEGDDVRNWFFVEPDRNGSWVVRAKWVNRLSGLRVNGGKILKGHSQAYSVERVVRDNGQERALRDDEQREPTDYLLIFKDHLGKEVLKY